MKHHLYMYINFVLLLIAIIAEALPYGIIMQFMNPDGPAWIHKCSYFSMLPIGYGVIFPVICVVITFILIILNFIIIASEKSQRDWVLSYTTTAIGGIFMSACIYLLTPPTILNIIVLCSFIAMLLNYFIVYKRYNQ
jgi:hypothetical protein